MKTTLNTSDIARALQSDDNANWSYAGAQALAEYLEELEESSGEEMELDVVAIRCDYAQYESLPAWAAEYDPNGNEDGLHQEEDATEDEIDEKIREFIQDRGTLLEFSDGIIVSSF